MKIKLALVFLFIAMVSLAYSQNISVKSFRMLETDLDARVNYPKTDQNGEKCAVIKVVTTEQGFVWEGDALGITATEFKTSEYWLYIPRGAKRLTIKHAKLGMLRDYVYPLPIKEATVYEMVLTTAKVTTIIEQVEIPTQWVIINSEPEGCDVYINEQYVGTTPYTKKMELGSYNYRIEKNLYYTDAGKFELNETARKEMKVKLKPNHGFVKINTTPEQGAAVEIDGVPTNSNAPYTSQMLPLGKHKATVKMVMFSSKTEEFIITEGQTTNLTIAMEPNFATVNITTNPEAEIFIDDERKSSGTYTGRILPGLHTFEAKKDKYYSDKKQQEFSAGETANLSLHARAKTGKTDIISTPIDATIKLNGVSYGTTPASLKDLLIGEYTLTLEKQGYGTVTKNITITENQTLNISEKLATGMEVNITSSPAGAQLTIDGTNYGATPQSLSLNFGSHNIKLVNGKKEVTESISITQGGKIRWEFDVSELENLTDNRDEKTYKIVQMGTQIWMAENLAYKPISGNYWAYDNDQSNVTKYGYLYDWQAACKVCPIGWHLPSDDEWKQLNDFVGSKSVTRLKAKSGWGKNGNGTDDYGFSALPGGERYRGGQFRNIGYGGAWWSSSESNMYGVSYWFMSYNKSNIGKGYDYDKENYYSVRCVKDK
ncbi:MAG: FISUMP domain-containing protein [Bacteroidales bacterium]|jgi:uncharacterized protein (TIGR02145 family)|nr:FISUMP domain-containing protein [Bacteroidales bacterium]